MSFVITWLRLGVIASPNEYAISGGRLVPRSQARIVVELS
jgi:hypothetical protein